MIQLTNHAIDKLTAADAPIILGSYALGDAGNYIPNYLESKLRGNVVWEGTPSSPYVQNANLVRYSVYLDYNVGDFPIGEVVLYTRDKLPFAIGTFSELLNKEKAKNNTVGNSIRIDLYLSMVGSNYEMWMDYADSNANSDVPSVENVDMLPPSVNATPNVYVVQGNNYTSTSILAFTDRQGLWSLTNYKYRTNSPNMFRVVEASFRSVTIATEPSENLDVQYLGHKVVQFETGKLYGIVRRIKSVSSVAGVTTIVFETPFAEVPVAGDAFRVQEQDLDATTMARLPVASTTVKGVVQIGQGLSIDNGVLSIASESTDVLVPNVSKLNLLDTKKGNIYRVQSEKSSLDSFIAYRNTGYWSFDKYEMFFSGDVTSGTLKSVTLPIHLPMLGDFIVQVVTGVAQGEVRYVQQVKEIDGKTEVLVETAFSKALSQGDTVVIQKRYALEPKLPVATDKVLGGVKVGESLTVNSGGVLNIKPIVIPTPELNVPKVADLGSLPKAALAKPNMYVVRGATEEQSHFLAYVGDTDLWALSAYDLGTTGGVTHLVESQRSPTEITLDLDNEDYVPLYLGQVVVQASSGPSLGLLANVKTARVVDGKYIATLHTPLPSLSGNEVMLYVRDVRTTSNDQLPIASKRRLGIVRIGSGLEINNSGELSVSAIDLGGVVSVNGQAGEVKLTAADIPGSVVSVNNKTPDKDGNVDVTAEIPIASNKQLGGVKVPTGSNAYINVNSSGEINLSFTPVTSINGQSGDISITGLFTQQLIPSLNDFKETDIGYVDTSNVLNKPVGSKALIAQIQCFNYQSGFLQIWSEPGCQALRITDGSGDYQNWESTTPLATENQAGLLKPSGGLLVDNTGTLTLGKASTTQIGGVIIGDHLEVTAAGKLNVKFPVATDSEAGIVKVGEGLTIKQGTLSVELPEASGDISGTVTIGDTLTTYPTGALDIRPALPNRLGGVMVSTGLTSNMYGLTTVDLSNPVLVEADENLPKTGFVELNLPNGTLALAGKDVTFLTIYLAKDTTFTGVTVQEGFTPNAKQGSIVHIVKLPSNGTLLAYGGLEPITP